MVVETKDGEGRLTSLNCVKQTSAESSYGLGTLRSY